MRILGRGNKSKYGNLPAWGRRRKPLAGEAGCRNFRLRRAGYGCSAGLAGRGVDFVLGHMWNFIIGCASGDVVNFSF